MVNTSVKIYEQPASYVIGKNDSTYYAIKCSDGSITTDTNVSTLLTSIETTYGYYFFKGIFTLTIPLSITALSNYSTFDFSNASLTLANGANCYIISVESTTKITLKGGYFNGNASNQSSGGVIYINSARITSIQHMFIQGAYSGNAIVAGIGCEDGDISFNFIDGGSIIGGNLFSMEIFRNEINGGFETSYNCISLTATTHQVKPKIHDNTIYYGLIGIVVGGAVNGYISHNDIQLTKQQGIKVWSASRSNLIEGNNVWNCGRSSTIYDGIVIGYGAICQYNTIIGNRVYVNSSHQRYGIKEGDDADYNFFIANNVLNGGLLGAISIIGVHSIIKNNFGYTTESSGDGTITAGNSYVDITHGLAITPDIDKIRLLPQDNLYNRTLWVSDVGATTFRINISSVDIGDHVVGWEYKN